MAGIVNNKFFPNGQPEMNYQIMNQQQQQIPIGPQGYPQNMTNGGFRGRTSGANPEI